MYSSLRRGVEEGGGGGGGGRRKEERLFPREAPQRGGIRLLSLCRMRAAGGVAIADERPVCPPSLPPRLLPYLSIYLSLARALAGGRCTSIASLGAATTAAFLCVVPY